MDIGIEDRNKKNSVESWKILRSIAMHNVKLFNDHLDADIEKIAQMMI